MINFSIAVSREQLRPNYGEGFKGAPLVQPIWRNADGQTAGAAGQAMQHALRDGWKPIADQINTPALPKIGPELRVQH